MIDREAERSVARWVRLGERVADHIREDAPGTCRRCGTRVDVLEPGADAVCARCYLESDGSNARASTRPRRSPARPSPK